MSETCVIVIDKANLERLSQRKLTKERIFALAEFVSCGDIVVKHRGRSLSVLSYLPTPTDIIRIGKSGGNPMGEEQ